MPAGEPRLAQSLLSYDDDWLVSTESIAASGDELTVHVLGYSSGRIPRCCPDISSRLTWKWSGSSYVLTTPEPAHATLPYHG
jgi:hypothetical protein